MRKITTGNLYDFDGLETATVRELQRGYINACRHYPADYSKVCLVNLRKADLLNGLRRQNRPLCASIDQSISFGEAGSHCWRNQRLATYRTQDGRSYPDFKAGSMELKITKVATWRVVSQHG